MRQERAEPIEPIEPVGSVGSVGSASSADWVELRVHGVSGTPPQDILLSAHVQQVAGDARSRFFRRCDSVGIPVEEPDGHTLEAFHWGRHTAGSPTQALWLLFLPFGIVNAAQFMLPAPRGRWGRVGHGLAGAGLRATALLLTCLLVYAVQVITVDLVAWQWLGAAGQGKHWLLAAWTAVPVLLVLGLRLLQGAGARNVVAPDSDTPEDVTGPHRRWEADPPRRTPVVGVTRGGRRTTELARRGFFAGDPAAPTLRRLHLAAPLLMAALLLVWPAWAAAVPYAAVVRTAVLATGAAVLVVVLLLGDPEQSASVTDDPGRVLTAWRRVAGGLSRLALLAGLAAVVAAAVLVVRTDVAFAADSATGTAPGIEAVGRSLAVAAAAALAVLLLGNLLVAAIAARPDGVRPDWERRRDRPFRPYLGGTTAFCAASVGTSVGIGFSAAFIFAARFVLNGFAPVELQVGPLLRLVAVSWGLTALVLLVTAALVLGVGRRFAVAERFGDAADATLTPAGGRVRPSVRRAVASAMWAARVKNALGGVFLGLTLLAGVLTAGTLWVLVDGDRVLAVQRSSAAQLLVLAGTFVLATLGRGLYSLARGAVSDVDRRRGLNVVWDVIAFWPRSAHPFTPPPYSQVVVGDLRRRVSYHLGTLVPPGVRPQPPRRRLVLAGHSQGSLVSLATSVWLTEDELRRTGLVTFGSQIRLMFARAFPAYVNPRLLDDLWRRLDGRWCNLYRETDPLAGPVLSAEHRTVMETGLPPRSRPFVVAEDPARRGPRATWPTDPVHPVTGARACGRDWRLLDPVRSDAWLQTGTDRLHGHSDYPADPQWGDALRVGRGLPVPWAGLPAAPVRRAPASPPAGR